MRAFWTACSLAALASLLAPTPARACGGFFCSQVVVDQTGERILFTHDQDQNLVTYVQVRYQGEAKSFSWVLPVPGEPTVGVGTDDLFNALEQATTPQWNVNYHADGCPQLAYPTAYDSADGGPKSGAGGGGGGVTVVNSGQAGPYDYKVLAAGNPDALLQWLSGNGYDVTDQGGKLLRLYVDSSHYFVAVKLLPESSADDIQPIVLRYPEPLPCVPLRLTAVAATEDMGIRSWVLSDRRAVPQNYAEVRINEARIDWFGAGGNYQKLVSEAVDAAPGGEGFITEFAGSTSRMKQVLWQEGRYDLATLRTESDPVAFVQGLINQGFQGNRQLLAILREHIPEPQSLVDQGIPEQGFYNCMSCYAQALVGITFDPAATAAAIDERILQPRKDAQGLLDAHTYMTALFTTMSPSEMLDDPVFTYNADLPEVSNVHTADAYFDCSAGKNFYESPVHMVLPGGSSFWLASASAAQGGLSSAVAGPAAQTVRRLSENGPGTVLKDNTTLIQARLDGGGDTGGCAGCATGGGEMSAFGLLAAVALRRRSRRS